MNYQLGGNHAMPADLVDPERIKFENAARRIGREKNPKMPKMLTPTGGLFSSFFKTKVRLH
jgi:hypothetical protein